MNFQELKKKAIKVGVSDNSLNGAYCSKDEQLIFISSGMTCVVPWSRLALQTLEKEGFVRTKIKLDSYFMSPHDKIHYWNTLVDEFKKEESA